MKRKGIKKELTATQQTVIDVIQKEIIDRYFSPAVEDDQFEILSTIRYDPCFTHIFPEDQDNGQQIHTDEIDSRLRLLDYDQSELFPPAESNNNDDRTFADFFSNLTKSSPSNNDYEDSLMSLMESNSGTQQSTPPAFSQDETDLYSIFYDRFLLLGEHYKRLNFTLEFFKWGFHVPLKLLLDKLLDALAERYDNLSTEEKLRLLIHERACYKMRVLISSSGRMRVEAHPLPRIPVSIFAPSTSQYFINTILSGFLPSSDPTWNVFVDIKPISVSPFTTFKTTYRYHYNTARKRLAEMAANYGNSKQNEILVYNDAFQLMEGSITNVAIIERKKDEFNKMRFVTPSLASGCLCGTMRYYLLKKGLIDERPLDVRDLREGDIVILFNGVMGCVKGIIRKSLK